MAIDDEKSFFRKAAEKGAITAAAVAAVGGGSLWAAGQPHQVAENNALAANKNAAEEQATEQAHNELVEALNAQYSPDSVIAKVSLPQGGSLEGSADSAIKQVLGEEKYNQTKASFYDTLHDSAAYYKIPQPGDEFYIVQNNDEYLIVEPDHIVHESVDTLPTPETH